ncbi:phosphoglycerate kinase [Haloflavibacter putidus]|uniref:Phosphoglycerate kinase n=1 Tax=Haloflavibacter putidus TaxID=2576776 RepID=A0A507ZUV8_9FLAO|nr:phosphoglycerate kinase [Haloflavibacter putidus]TQD40737.1 phosphoglycerate kinase [Haloflavibacter putidus]
MKTLDNYNFSNKKALIRVDFNVPLNENFEVTDTTRIEAAKPSITKILEDGGAVVLMSHLGRPVGKEEKFSLKHITSKVSEILGVQVKFVDDCVSDEAFAASEKLENGEILLLENLRFYQEEKEGNEDFAQQLAKHGDIYVNDAFGTAHRAHASTAVIAKYFENKRAGRLLEKEINNLDKVLNAKEKPVTAILGGAKVSSKITVIENILEKIDHLIIGGGMTFTFIKAQGGEIGDSLVEEDKLNLALDILKLAKKRNVEVHLPVDSVVADKFDKNANTKTMPVDAIENGWMGLDIGTKSVANFTEIIKASQIILWNGPMGVFEMEKFAEGTIKIGEAIAAATKNGTFSLVGGGDSVAAVKQFGLENRVSYVSTGGGAMLEMLEGKSLPGIAALEN